MIVSIIKPIVSVVLWKKVKYQKIQNFLFSFNIFILCFYFIPSHDLFFLSHPNQFFLSYLIHIFHSTHPFHTTFVEDPRDVRLEKSILEVWFFGDQVFRGGGHEVVGAWVDGIVGSWGWVG